MDRIIKVILVLIMLVSAALSGAIVIEGRVPSGINPDSLEKEYLRIRRVFEPHYVHDGYENPITIIYYKKSEVRRLGVRLPEWGGGGALGKDSIIIPVDRKYAFYPADYYLITLHELVHIALARSYGNIRVPRWFHEGLAMQLSGEVSFEEGVILSRAILSGALMPLDSIEHVNRLSQYRAELAYCQCHFSMQYMTKLYGYDMLPELLDSTRACRSFDTACVRVFGLTPVEFDHTVKTELVKKYKYAFVFSDLDFLWIVIFFLALAAFIATVIRNRHKRKRLEDEDKKEDEETIADESENPYICDDSVNVAVNGDAPPEKPQS